MSPQAPLQLARCDADGRLHLEPHATEWLQALARPIGVLAVVGPQRSGKSSLLNDLLGDGMITFRTSAAVTRYARHRRRAWR